MFLLLVNRFHEMPQCSQLSATNDFVLKLYPIFNINHLQTESPSWYHYMILISNRGIVPFHLRRYCLTPTPALNARRYWDIFSRGSSQGEKILRKHHTRCPTLVFASIKWILCFNKMFWGTSCLILQDWCLNTIAMLRETFLLRNLLHGDSLIQKMRDG